MKKTEIKKIRKGKSFVEIEDIFGWKTRFEYRKSMDDLNIRQESEPIKRMVYLNTEELEELLKYLKEQSKWTNHWVKRK